MKRHNEYSNQTGERWLNTIVSSIRAGRGARSIRLVRFNHYKLLEPQNTYRSCYNGDSYE